MEIAQIVFTISMEKRHAIRFLELLNVKHFKRETPTSPEVLCKNGALKSFATLIGKHLCWSLFISGDFFKK